MWAERRKAFAVKKGQGGLRVARVRKGEYSYEVREKKNSKVRGVL